MLGAAALGLAAAVAVALVYFLAPFATKPAPALVAESADPGVTVDGRPADRGTRVTESSALVLPDGAMTRLAYGRGFTMTLVGPCALTIDRLASRGTSGGTVMECTLEQGMLVSTNEGGSLVYAYSTPGARVEPTGTEFLLQASGDSTLVIMKSGRAAVRSLRSGENGIVPAGSRCTVYGRVRIVPASPEDLKMVDDREGLRSGAFKRGLLPVLPLKARVQGERPSGDRNKGGGIFRGGNRTAGGEERRTEDLINDAQGADATGGTAVKREDKGRNGSGLNDRRRERDPRTEKREKGRARRGMR